MLDKIDCLDHGFVRIVANMGDDAAIVQAARVSYGAGTKSYSEDQELINYLMRHRHTTPFEMVEFKFHIKMPIFVMRQWIRHRTANVNEYSARYSILDGEFYIPEADKLATQSTKNKQGRDEKLSSREAAYILKLLQQDSVQCYSNYQYMLNDPNWEFHDDSRPQLARELARMNLPVNIYTQCYWKIDLHNLFHFLGLRMDSHAQYEIRVFANAMYEIIKQYVPMACNAFEEYRLHAITLSRKEINAMRALIKTKDAIHPEIPAGFSNGEWREFVAKFEKMSSQ